MGRAAELNFLSIMGTPITGAHQRRASGQSQNRQGTRRQHSADTFAIAEEMIE
jgi:hypothetical protein